MVISIESLKPRVFSLDEKETLTANHVRGSGFLVAILLRHRAQLHAKLALHFSPINLPVVRKSTTATTRVPGPAKGHKVERRGFESEHTTENTYFW